MLSRDIYIYIYAHIGHMLLIYAVIYGEIWGSNLLHLIPADEWLMDIFQHWIQTLQETLFFRINNHGLVP